MFEKHRHQIEAYCKLNVRKELKVERREKNQAVDIFFLNQIMVGCLSDSTGSRIVLSIQS